MPRRSDPGAPPARLRNAPPAGRRRWTACARRSRRNTSRTSRFLRASRRIRSRWPPVARPDCGTRAAGGDKTQFTRSPNFRVSSPGVGWKRLQYGHSKSEYSMIDTSAAGFPRMWSRLRDTGLAAPTRSRSADSRCSSAACWAARWRLTTRVIASSTARSSTPSASSLRTIASTSAGSGSAVDRAGGSAACAGSIAVAATRNIPIRFFMGNPMALGAVIECGDGSGFVGCGRSRGDVLGGGPGDALAAVPHAQPRRAHRDARQHTDDQRREARGDQPVPAQEHAR